jgi:hypothetical protein
MDCVERREMLLITLDVTVQLGELEMFWKRGYPLL